MTELTAELSLSSTPVSSTAGDLQPVPLTLSVINNQATAADVSGGMIVGFAVDPGISGPAGMNGPVEALLASNLSVNPYGTGQPAPLSDVQAAVPPDALWTASQGSLAGATVTFQFTPDGPGQNTIPPGGSVTFSFSDIAVNMVPGVSTISVAVLAPGTAIIAAPPQVQKTPVPLQAPVLAALPPLLVPPSNETVLTWSNAGAATCDLFWDKTSTKVEYNGIQQGQGDSWPAPLIVPATQPVTAVLMTTTAFTLNALGSGADGTPAYSQASEVVILSLPAFNPITLPPVVSGVYPPGGDPAGGQQVIVAGSGFSEASAVTFTPAGAAGLTATGLIVISDTQLIATTPAGSTGAATATVTVSTPVGTSLATPASQYCYSAAGQPIVTGVSPAYGDAAGGQPVTITGTGLTGATAVTFAPTGRAGLAATAANVTVVSDTELTATAPACGSTGIADVTVTVTTAATGTTAATETTSVASAASQYTYIPAGSPFVTGVSPAYGIGGGGQPVTITGTGLTGATAVTFTPVGAAASAGVTATSISNDLASPDTTVTAITPAAAGAGPVDVTVTTASAQASGAASPATPADVFSYTAAIGAIAPYQQFQLNWSSYTGSAPVLTWQFAGDQSIGDPAFTDDITVTAGSVSLSAGGTLPIAGSALVTVSGPSSFALSYFAAAGPPALPISVAIAEVMLGSFEVSAPAVGWGGSQYVILTWTASNATSFRLAGGTGFPPVLAHSDRILFQSLSGPTAFQLTAYGYDASGGGTSVTLPTVPATIEPYPVALWDFGWSDLRLSDDGSGRQEVTLTWQAAYATGFTLTWAAANADTGAPVAGGTIPGSLGPGVTTTSLILPVAGPPGPLAYSITITADGYRTSGSPCTQTVTVIPSPVQLTSLTVAPPKVVKRGDAQTLSWIADYATGFTLSPDPVPGGIAPGNRAMVVSPAVPTYYTLTAQGYPPGPALPQLSIWAGTKVKEGKEDSDKHLTKEQLPDILPFTAGAVLPDDADAADAEAAGPGEPEGGQQAFIGPDERPDVGAHLRNSEPAAPPPALA